MEGPINIFSDSHNCMFDAQHRLDKNNPEPYPFRIKSGKSFTAHSLSAHDNEIRPLLEEVKGEKCWFGYGEIDCRFYIFNQCVKNKTTIDYEVEKVVKYYLNYVSCFVKDGHDISIVSIVPAQRSEFSNVDPSTNETGNGGTCFERRTITRTFNRELKTYCGFKGIDFIDIYHLLEDPIDGLTNESMLLRPGDTMHYAYIGDLLLEKGII